MAIHTDFGLRSELFRYATGAISLDEFQDWFVPLYWTIHDAHNPEAEALANQIQGMLSEASTAHWPEAELRRRLLTLARTHAVETSSKH